MNQVLNLSSDEIDSAFIIRVEGAIDATSTMQFGVFTNNIIDENISNIIFDFSKLNYINSMGLGTIVSLIKKLREDKKRVIFFGVNEEIYHLFDMCGLNDLFPVFSSEDEAISELNN